jgi:hypothetical protein
VWLVVGVIAVVTPLLGIVEGVTLDADIWAQTLGEIAVLCVSVALLRSLREIDRERGSSKYAEEDLCTSEVPVNRPNTEHDVDEVRDTVVAQG